MSPFVKGNWGGCSPFINLLLDNFLLNTGQNGFGMLPMSKLEHVIPAPASRLLGFAESQPNLICYGVSGLKPGSVSLLVPSLKAGVILRSSA